MEKRKGVIEHLPTYLLVSEVTLEAINDDKHFTGMILPSLTRKNLGILHQLRK